MSRSLRRVGMPCRYVVPRLEALRGEARAGPRANLSYLPRAGSRTSPMINQMKTMENQMETMKLTLDKVAAVNLKQEEEVGESLEEVLSEKISTATMMHDLETRLKEDGEFQTINCHDTNPLVNEAFAVNNSMSEVESLKETTDPEYVDLLEIMSKFKAPVTGLAVGYCTSILPFKTSNTVSFICSYCKKLERPPKMKPENNVKSDQDCANEPNSLDVNSNECILNKNSTHDNEENSITLCESDNNDMSTILNNIFPDCSDKMKTFLISQKMALERHPNGRRWNRDIVQLCLSLWCRSPVGILI
ncbi:unnamed protein product [Mytilus edulis]|uniref:Uncharacterized protein n=1 Tax=Mytilus edulis TaxID=6550 RepID=A0A8S3PVK4_MYTED|nr:unnamed protein product [Mytilus edulis]